MRAIYYWVVYLLPIAIFTGYFLGGWYNFWTPFIVFVLVPIVDLLIGRNMVNPTEAEQEQQKEALKFKLPTWLSVPVQVSVVIWGAYVIGTKDLTLVEIIGLTISIGLQGGVIGINIAHEMIHRGNKFERGLGQTLLLTVSYLHWWLEHVAGHHMNVSTPEDAATARFGESFYRFWPRTVIGGFKSAWRIEKRLRFRRSKSVWSPGNRVIRYALLTILVPIAFFTLGGLSALTFFMVQSIVAFTLLEIVNYIEHYGLLRGKTEDGQYEKVTAIHSWNASERLTNWFLFNLQRHSDHHAQPRRRYQNLRHFDHSPQLPAGYAAMVPLALIPPLWFAVINPKVPENMKRMAGK